MTDVIGILQAPAMAMDGMKLPTPKAHSLRLVTNRLPKKPQEKQDKRRERRNVLFPDKHQLRPKRESKKSVSELWIFDQRPSENAAQDEEISLFGPAAGCCQSSSLAAGK